MVYANIGCYSVELNYVGIFLYYSILFLILQNFYAGDVLPLRFFMIV